MAIWLLKSEPDVYAYADLAADKRCVWDGVTNALALKHIRAMQKGDTAYVYHTGKEKAVVGVADVITNAYADPKQTDDRIVVVDLKPKRALARPVTLAEIKADKAFDGWELIRIGRLSVMPVPAAMAARIEQLAKAKP